MMRHFLVILIFNLFAFSVAGQSNKGIKDIMPFFSYSTFYSYEQGSYIEFYLIISGNSLYLKKSDNGYFSEVEATYLIKKGDTIIEFRKLSFQTPTINDTSKIDYSIVDLQRFALPNGKYNVELILLDKNSPLGKFVIKDYFILDFNEDKPLISGIQLIERYQKTEQTSNLKKGDYELVPLPINFFPTSIKKLAFYVEFYNLDKIGDDEPVLIKTYVSNYETNSILHDLHLIKREKAKKQISYLNQINIEKLTTGNYWLNVEVVDKENKLLANNRLFFQRMNKELDSIKYFTSVSDIPEYWKQITDKEKLIYHIRSLRPIATESEKIFIDKKLLAIDDNVLQNFLHQFWYSRYKDEELAIKEFEKYNVEVQKVEKAYGTRIKRGYETDRGRVYLQYGPPNSITTQENEPSSYPYEIWHYYTIKNQRNRKFVFYNTDLVTNDYELLHSDVRGEVYNPQWQVKLNLRNFATNDPDLERWDWGWGSKANEYWQYPR